jgi:lysozyme
MPIQPPMTVDQKGKNLFAQWEGNIPQVYLDSGGQPTIGIGHLLTQSERSSGQIVIGGVAVAYAGGLTPQQCFDLLDQDLQEAEATVNAAVDVALNQNQFTALVSFTFNLGGAAFTGSTLLTLLNEGRYPQIPGQMILWVHSHGLVVKGLINRRNDEIALWNTPAA